MASAYGLSLRYMDESIASAQASIAANQASITANQFVLGVETVTATTHTATTTSPVVILADDDTANDVVTISLPAADTATGRRYKVKKLGTTANVVIDANASETIDGATTVTLTTQYETVEIVCDGTSWHIV